MLLLAGCGGGGSAPVVSTPPPAPPFPAKSSASYTATSGTIGYQGVVFNQFAGGSATILPTQVQPANGATTVAYDASTQTYTVASAAGTASFAPANQTPASDYSVQYKNGNDSLYLYGNAQAGVTASPPVALSYASFAVWTHVDPTSNLNQQTFYLIGQATPTTGMPVTGSASYNATLRAEVLQYTGSTLVATNTFGGSATLTANFATGAIATTLTPDPTSLGGNVTLQPNYTGTGTISGSGFSGTLSGPGGNVATSGAFSGGFFGPTASEAGFTFQIANHIIDPGAGASVPAFLNEVVVGVAVGAKK